MQSLRRVNTMTPGQLLNLGDPNKFIPLRLGLALFIAYDLATRINNAHIWLNGSLSLLQSTAIATGDITIIDKVNKMTENQTEENIKAACDEYCKKLAEEIAKDELKHSA